MFLNWTSLKCINEDLNRQGCCVSAHPLSYQQQMTFDWVHFILVSLWSCNKALKLLSGRKQLLSPPPFFNVNAKAAVPPRSLAAASLINVHNSLLLYSEFMMVQLFQLTTTTRHVSMTTTETTARETIQEQILLVTEFPEWDRSIKRNCIRKSSTSKSDDLVWDNKQHLLYLLEKLSLLIVQYC